MTSKEYEQAVERADHRRQKIKELTASINSHRCPKCGSMLAHYRLYGLRCINLNCSGPYGGGKGEITSGDKEIIT
jgi:hypothetical protein